MNAHMVTLFVFGAIGVLIIVLAVMKAIKMDDWVPLALKTMFLLIVLFFASQISMLMIPYGTTWP